MKAGFCLYKKKEKQNKKHIQFRNQKNQKYLFYSYNLNRIEDEEEEMGLTVEN
jgi:hypothetical protein